MSRDVHPSPSFSAGQRFHVGFNVTLAVVALLALVVMVNYLGARHFRRWYWTDSADFQLKPLTVSVLRSLTNQVNVVVFFDTDEGIYKSIHGLLQEYSARAFELHRGEPGPPRLVVETVDPDRNPGRAKELRAKYQLPQLDDSNFLLFECQGRRRVVRELELSEYDARRADDGQKLEFHRSKFKGELMFTSAIVSVTDPQPPKAYFLQGHVEHDPDNESENTSGYSQFARVLEEKYIAWDKLFLVGTNDLPADCNVLIIAGPGDAFVPSELDKIQKHLTQGGRLLVLLRSLTKKTGLEKLLANWGIEIGDNVVLDKPNTVMGQDLLTTNLTAHAIVKPLRQSRLHLLLPRSVGKRAQGTPTADAPRVDEIVLTSEHGVAASDIRDGAIYENPGRDRRGAIPLAVAVEKGNIQGVSADRGSTRIVVTGDSTFLANQLLPSAANREFASLAVNWLLDRPQLVEGLGAQPVRSYKVVMTDAELGVARWIFLLGLPGGVMLLGGLVWLRRRS